MALYKCVVVLVTKLGGGECNNVAHLCACFLLSLAAGDCVCLVLRAFKHIQLYLLSLLSVCGLLVYCVAPSYI